MHTTNSLLDAVSVKYGNATDYRLSKLLGTSQSAVTNWRKGRSSLSADYAHKVATLLEWEPAYVLACVESERAQKDTRLDQTDEIVATWEKIADRFRPAVPSILLVVAALVGALHSPAASASCAGNVENGFFNRDMYYTCCALRHWRRLVKRWFATWLPAIEPASVLAGA